MKTIKWIQQLEDGTMLVADGQDAENFNHNLDVVNGLLVSRSYMNLKEVNWNKTKD